MKLTVQFAGDALDISVEDTGAGFGAAVQSKGHGVGLSNVERRLAICYGAAAKLEIESADGRTRVGFRVPVPQPVGTSQ